MGQVQSDEYDDDNGQVEDVSDLEINSRDGEIQQQQQQQQQHHQPSQEKLDERQEGKRGLVSVDGSKFASSQTKVSKNGNNIEGKLVHFFSKAYANIGKQTKTATINELKASDLSCYTGDNQDNPAAKGRPDELGAGAHHHVRKLSNVSHRNIQLLSLKPRSELDAYAEGLRQRRRSSLINLILGAPSSGPRFCDDLCSLSSHMSELCNFGIEFFPDANPTRPANPAKAHGRQHLGSISSAGSSCWRLGAWGPPGAAVDVESGRGCVLAGARLAGVGVGPGANDQVDGQGLVVGGGPGEPADDHGDVGGKRTTGNQQKRQQQPAAQPSSRPSFAPTNNEGQLMDYYQRGHHRRRSSLGSLTNVVGRPSADSYGLNKRQPVPGTDRDKDSREQPAQHPATSTLTSSHQDQGEAKSQPKRHEFARRGPAPSLASTALASIDLTSSFEGAHLVGCIPGREGPISEPLSCSGADDVCDQGERASDPVKGWWPGRYFGASNSANKPTRAALYDDSTAMPEHRRPTDNEANLSMAQRFTKGRINLNGRVLRRSGSEVSLYSATLSASSAYSNAGLLTPMEGDNSAASDTNNYNFYHHRQRSATGLIKGSARLSSSSIESSAPATSIASILPWMRASRAPTKSTKTTGKANCLDQPKQTARDPVRETKLIIMLQVCLPFILAGFGNMAAGLVLNKVAHWRAFQNVPIFFVLLPSFVGLKGNIEMTLASRISTLSNLKLLDSSKQRCRAYVSNLILILGQVIGFSFFAVIMSMLCEVMLGGKLNMAHSSVDSGKLDSGPLATPWQTMFELVGLIILPSALITGIVLVILSSCVVTAAVALANYIQVNPDNLSTLVAALYGDVTCVLTYGLFAELMYSLRTQNNLLWPSLILSISLVSCPVLCYLAYKFKETNRIVVSSMPPMMTAIMVSMGSGTVLSLVVDRFHLIALYQPVVNGFGANLIAVQSSRVSTWLWCKELNKQVSIRRKNTIDSIESNNERKLSDCKKPIPGSFASFEYPIDALTNGNKYKMANSVKNSLVQDIMVWANKLMRTVFWSFFNSSPNSVAARLLLIMIVPAHTLYFFAICLLAPANSVSITWAFYLIYMTLCIVQVFVLLTLCEPLMTLFMKRQLDPDVFGISFLMALADLVGTVCLAGAFFLLAWLGDKNALY